MLTLESVCEERGEGFGILDCLPPRLDKRLWREIMARIFLDRRCCRNNSSSWELRK